MIKCDKSEVWIRGNIHVILAECGVLLSNVYQMLVEKEGKEKAKEDMKIMLEAAFLSDEELAAKNKEMKEELPPVLQDLVENLMDFFMD